MNILLLYIRTSKDRGIHPRRWPYGGAVIVAITAGGLSPLDFLTNLFFLFSSSLFQVLLTGGGNSLFIKKMNK